MHTLVEDKLSGIKHRLKPCFSVNSTVYLWKQMERERETDKQMRREGERGDMGGILGKDMVWIMWITTWLIHCICTYSNRQRHIDMHPTEK